MVGSAQVLPLGVVNLTHDTVQLARIFALGVLAQQHRRPLIDLVILMLGIIYLYDVVGHNMLVLCGVLNGEEIRQGAVVVTYLVRAVGIVVLCLQGIGVTRVLQQLEARGSLSFFPFLQQHIALIEPVHRLLIAFQLFYFDFAERAQGLFVPFFLRLQDGYHQVGLAAIGGVRIVRQVLLQVVLCILLAFLKTCFNFSELFFHLVGVYGQHQT